MLPIHLALVSLTDQVSFSELAKVSAAIQKQITRDFGPIWTVEATIDAFAAQQDVPLGYWKILVVDTFDHGGQHKDRNNQPYALVATGPSWSLIASHEAMEMLADPFGNRLVAGESPIAEQGRVELLVEVCDPCQSEACCYTVNGVLVSDFCTPNYFDPLQAEGVRYSFTGAVKAPRQVLDGGYLSWREPESLDWFQEHRLNGQSQFKNLGQIAPGSVSLREFIDRQTREADPTLLTSDKPLPERAKRLREAAEHGAEAAARDFKAQLPRSITYRDKG